MLNTLIAAVSRIVLQQRDQTCRWLICGYFLVLLSIIPFNLLAFDTYYYWDWSRHPDLSYYDGPPLIAYIIRFMVFLTGHAVYGLTLISILFIALTSRILYKTARLLLNEKTSYLVTFFWLVSPIVTQDLLIQVTYDTPMTFFWACSLYYALSFIKTNQNHTLYFLGISLGFLLLSKYTGIVLIGGLFIFMLFSSYYRLFKNPHFYAAMLLTTVLFLPVIYWNIQHDWLSFNYQMHTHQTDPSHQGWWLAIQTFMTKILPVLNLTLLPPFIILKYRKSALADNSLRFLVVISWWFLGFYILMSTMVNLRNAWLTQYTLTGVLLVGWLMQYFFDEDKSLLLKKRYEKMLKGFIALNALISFLILMNACIHFVPSKNFTYYQLIQRFNQEYPDQLSTVFTSGWMEARMLFFLKDKPIIYTISCHQNQNSYQLWSEEIQANIQQGYLKSILSINTFDNQTCLQQYFQHCERQSTSVISGRSLYVYRCVGPKQKMTSSN